jgi:hypothetical protein
MYIIEWRDTEVLAGIFGGLVVAIAAVAVVIGTDGAQSATSHQPARSIAPTREPAEPSPAVTTQNGDPGDVPVAQMRTM